MDFSKFKVEEQKNNIATAITTTTVLSKTLEGTSPKLVLGYHIYPQVYQGCDKCKTEVLHVIIRNEVKCLGCESTYKLEQVT